MAMGNGKAGGDTKLPAEYWKALLGDRLLLGSLIVMSAYWKLGSWNLLRLLLTPVQLQQATP
jgi:hypothetical protein